MTIHARQLCFVEVPHRPGWVLDDDEAILEAYADGTRRLPRDRSLWEARSGRRCAWWSIWDGETVTGELVGHHTAAATRVPQLLGTVTARRLAKASRASLGVLICRLAGRPSPRITFVRHL